MALAIFCNRHSLLDGGRVAILRRSTSTNRRASDSDGGRYPADKKHLEIPMSKKAINPLTLTLGAALLGAVGMANAGSFALNDLGTGYMLTGDKAAEGKCGEGKCGEKKAEGACGEKAKAEGACGEKAKAEGKCGEGKCGEGKCGEGKCGEGHDGKKAEGACGEKKAAEASCGEKKK
jgi:uncharacterized low-complexity protein